MKNSFFDFSKVDINQGFWHNRQIGNADMTIFSIYDRFEDTGRFEALKLNWREGHPHQPHIFWDSDVYKWIESAAYIIQKNGDERLIRLCDELIDIIEEKQEECGYYNSYFQSIEPHARFTRRVEHELYCAGCMMETGVAYFNATKKDKLLKCACKYADYIETVFVKEKSAQFITPGHEEIELALIKLYHATNEKRYLELSKFFIDNRGKSDESSYDFALARYAQDHLPVREQTTAEGHAVRACYLYCAMADLAEEYGDKTLKNACKAIFENILNKRVYITGGIGSTYLGEAFTIDYDLPNDDAYSESCAAISLVFFAQRMLKLEINSKYSDMIERILYNGFLSSISLNSKAFFYKNPLEIIPQFKNRYPSTADTRNFPELERLEVFECSCCPPNISRLLATIGSYIYSENEDTLFVHQYISSTAENITMESGFPNNGNVRIRLNGYKSVALRLPWWCEHYEIKQNRKTAEYTVKDGYAYLSGNTSFDIEISFDMPVVLMESNANIIQNSGKVCIMRGPVVFCAERVDNVTDIHSLYINKNLNADISFDPLFGTNTLTIDGFIKEKSEKLYKKLDSDFTPTKIKLIPYFGFANRGASEMMVWMNIW